MSEELYSSGYGDSSAETGVEEPSYGSTGQEGEEAGTWEEQGASGETGGEGEEPTYEIDGKTYTLSELRELIKSGMLERDYRIKTAQLAEERRQLAQLRQAAEAWQALQQYPELVETLRQKVIEILQGGGQQAPQLQQSPFMGGDQQEVDPVQRELQQLRYQLATLQQDYATRVQQYNQYLWQQWYAQREAYARSQLEGLKQKYPMLYEEEVIEAFKMDPNADLETLARASHEHWNKFVSERAKVDMAKRMENAKARVAAPAARGGIPATPKHTPQTFDEASKAAIERLIQSGLFAKR